MGQQTTPGPRVRRRAGLLAIVALLYASTCGGPYGTEEYVALTGPGLFILILFVTPWIYGIPMALATAELAIRRPVEGGYYRWAREYLGEFWGYQAGAWSLISSIFDNALYPVLFGHALVHWFPGIPAWGRWAAAASMILILTYLNFLGIRIAGATAVALNLLLFLPVVWIVVAGLLQARYNPVVPFLAPGLGPMEALGNGLSLSLWLYSGYFEVSTAAEEIERPSRNIPLALLVVTPLVIFSYAAPNLAALAAYGGWERWTSGTFTAVGRAFGGPVLEQWAFLGAVCSYTVIFMTFLLWWSRLAWAMAADGYLPGFLSRLHPKRGTPHRILWIYAVLYCALAAFDFEDLLVADVWLSGAFTLLLLASFLKARLASPDGPPGFRVPGGRAVAWTIVLVPAATWVALLVTTARDHFLVGSGVLLLGPAAYWIQRAIRRRAARDRVD
jgi:APA family basic amino acid/polyamine antiporter